MELKARLNDLHPTLEGDMIISVRISRDDSRECLKGYDDLKGGDVTFKVTKYRQKRSTDANAYFHLLVGKIAQKLNLGSDEVKVNMVLEYGTVDTDDEGAKVGVKLPISVDVKKYYEYAKWFDKRMEDGMEFNCYIFYKKTRELDSKEMARLIDGVVYEAQQLGIGTMTPSEIAALASVWKPCA